jgi:3-dehydroquinate synthase
MKFNNQSFASAWRQLPSKGFWLSLLIFFFIIIASFLLFEIHFSNLIIQLIQSSEKNLLQTLSVALIIILLLTLDIVLPIPSTMVALLAVTLLGFYGGSLVIFIGLSGGTIFGYLLGAGYFRLMSGWLSKNDQQLAGNFAGKLGTLMLVCLRGVPIFAEISVLAAGMQGYPFRLFLLITALANAGLALAYGYIGSFLAGKEAFVLIVLASIALPCLFLISRGIVLLIRILLRAHKTNRSVDNAPEYKL